MLVQSHLQLNDFLSLLEVVKKFSTKVKLKEPSVLLSDERSLFDIGVGVVEVSLPTFSVGGQVYEVNLGLVSKLVDVFKDQMEESVSLQFLDNRGEVKVGQLRVSFSVLNRFSHLPFEISVDSVGQSLNGELLKALKDVIQFAVVVTGIFLWSKVIFVVDDYIYYSSGIYVVRRYHGKKIGKPYVFVTDLFEEVLSLFSSPRIITLDRGWLFEEDGKRLFLSNLDLDSVDFSIYNAFVPDVDWVVRAVPSHVREEMKSILSVFSVKDEVDLILSKEGCLLKVVTGDGQEVEFNFKLEVLKDVKLKFYVGVLKKLIDVFCNVGLVDDRVVMEDDTGLCQVVCSSMGELSGVVFETNSEGGDRDG